MSAIERVVRDLPEAGPDVMATSSGGVNLAWTRPHPAEEGGNIYRRSRLGSNATAPNLDYDGVRDVDASGRASE